MNLNYPAVIVSAIVHFMLGGIWYGPIFGHTFLRIVQWTPEQQEQIVSQTNWTHYLLAFVASFVLVYILAHFVQYTKAASVLNGMQTGFWLWLGFVATTQLPTVIFEQRKLGLFLLNVGYQLVGCLICGAILAVWRPRAASDAVAEPA